MPGKVLKERSAQLAGRSVTKYILFLWWAEKVLKVAVGLKRGDQRRRNKLLRLDSPGLA